MKKYVLTGGPGSGKSSILLYLEMKGEATIREAAEDYIRLMQAKGTAKPWNDCFFQENIMDLQIRRESNPPRAKRLFIDRGVPDGLAYQAQRPECEELRKMREYAQLGFAPDGNFYTRLNHEHYHRIEREAKWRNYSMIFLVEQLGETKKTRVRRESHEEAKALELRLEEVYKRLGYSPIRIPAGTVLQRASRMLNEVEKYEKQEERR